MPRVPSAAAAHVGAQIANARSRQGLTQVELAVRSSIESSNIRSYESGRALMNIYSLARIAEALDVELGDLLDGVASDMFTPARAASPRGGR